MSKDIFIRILNNKIKETGKEGIIHCYSVNKEKQIEDICKKHKYDERIKLPKIFKKLKRGADNSPRAVKNKEKKKKKKISKVKKRKVLKEK